VGKTRRGGYVFVTWKSDLTMKGRASARILALIRELEGEGLL